MEKQDIERKLNELKRITGLSLDITMPSSDETKEISYTIEQLDALIGAYKEKNSQTVIFQKWIRGEMDVSELYRTAKSFHIPLLATRSLFLIEMTDSSDEYILSILTHSFPDTLGTWFVPMSTEHLAMVHTFPENTPETELLSTAYLVMDILNAEAMIQAKIAYSAFIEHLEQLPKAFEDASRSLNIGKIFYPGRNIYPYDQQGMGRLLYGLSKEQCMTYIHEAIGDCPLSFFQPETVHVINCFLNNNLNIAETTRQLHMHRNTLIYRIEQIQKETGLDIRHFNDAMTLKTVLFVINYLNNL